MTDDQPPAQHAEVDCAPGEDAAVDAAQPSDAGPAAKTLANVAACIELGWTMAEIFHGATVHSGIDFAQSACEQPETDDSGAVARLVGGGDLNPGSEMEIRVNAVAKRLTASLGDPALDAYVRDLADAAESGMAKRILDATQHLHIRLLINLSAADPQSAVAYGLGRALADSALLSTDSGVSGSGEDRLNRLREELNPWRVATLIRWLAALAADLPSGLADAVAGSIFVWATWVNGPRASTEDLGLRFNRQADRWRDLLAGHADLQVLGSIDDEVTAASLAFRTSRVLAWRLVKTYWFVALTTVGIVVAMIAAAVWWSPSTGKAVLSVGAVLAALGVSWKGVGASLSASASAIGTKFGTVIEREELMLASLVRPPGLEKTKDFLNYRKSISTST